MMPKYWPKGLDLGSRDGNGYRLAKDVISYDMFTIDHFEPYGDWAPPYKEVGSILFFLSNCEGGLLFRHGMSQEELKEAEDRAFSNLLKGDKPLAA